MTPTRHRLAGPVAAALVAAAGLVGLTSGTAHAAVCSRTGISAVVDFNDGAGGGVSTRCVAASGSKGAAAVFAAAGHTMRRNTDGSVCQVDHKPANADCQHLGSQYWALWWSDGTNGQWVYSQQGVDNLTVPKNGSVAWAWQGPSGRRQPGAAPPVVRPAPKPTPSPSKSPAPKPSHAPRGQGGGGHTKAAHPVATKAPTPTSAPRSTTAASPTAGASGAGSTRHRNRAAVRSAASVGPTPSDAATPSVEASPLSETLGPSASPAADAAGVADSAYSPGEQHSSMPAWVPIAVIVLLAGVAGGAALWRKRSGPV